MTSVIRRVRSPRSSPLRWGKRTLSTLGVSDAVSTGPEDEEAAGSDGALTCGLVLPG